MLPTTTLYTRQHPYKIRRPSRSDTEYRDLRTVNGFIHKGRLQTWTLIEAFDNRHGCKNNPTLERASASLTENSKSRVGTEYPALFLLLVRNANASNHYCKGKNLEADQIDRASSPSAHSDLSDRCLRFAEVRS